MAGEPDRAFQEARRLLVRRSWLLLPVLLAAACKTADTPRLDLMEARKISSEVTRTEFLPPPRTIVDVLAILDAQKPDQNKLRFYNVQANREISPNLPAEMKWEAHFNRAYFRDLSGRSEEALADYRTAVNLKTLPLNDEAWAVPVERLGLREAEAGNFQLGVYVVGQALNRWGGRHYSLNLIMAKVLALAGDIDGAERYAGIANDMLLSVTRWTNGPPDRLQQADLQALLHEMKGEWYSAEPLRRSLLRMSGVNRGRYVTMTNFREMVQNDLARNLLEQGRTAEAESMVRQSIEALLKEVGKYNLDTVSSLNLLGEVLLAKNRQKDAVTLARAILNILDTMGVPAESRSRGKANHLLGKSLAAEGEWRAATDAFAKVRTAFQDKPYFYWQLYGQDSDVLLTLVLSGESVQTAELLGPTIELRRKQFGDDHYDTNEALAILAATQARDGKLIEARELFRRTFPALTRLVAAESGITRKDVERHRRRKVILERYIDLLARLHQSEANEGTRAEIAAELFSVVDLAHQGTVFQALGFSAARNLAKDEDTRRLLREEQDAGLQIGRLEELLTAALGNPDTAQALIAASLQSRVAQVREAKASLRAEIQRRIPQYSDIISSNAASISAVQRDLAPDESLLLLYEAEQRVYAWAVPKTGKVTFSAVDVSRRALTESVNHLRTALDPNVKSISDIPAYDVSAAYQLFDKVLNPVREGWRRARSLIVVAPGQLGRIPFSVLPTEPATVKAEDGVPFSGYRRVKWLAREYATTSLPTVGALRTLRSATSSAPATGGFVAFADPIFSEEQNAAPQHLATNGPSAPGETTGRGGPSQYVINRRSSLDLRGVSRAAMERLPRLPETADEVRRMATFMGDKSAINIFTGISANEQAVKDFDLAGARVLAFATHGLVAGELDGLDEPALALSLPRLANIEGDGLLTAGEVYGLRLNAEWVVLSACNTAAADGGGTEMLSGLGKAFFYAGARALLASYWPVETRSAVTITTNLFRQQRDQPGISRAEALRRTTMEVADGPGLVDERGRTIYSYAHPMFWAPFMVFGDGGRSVNATGSLN